MAKKDQTASESEKVLAEIERIQKEAKDKLAAQVDRLKEALDAKRQEIRTLLKEEQHLVETIASITGKEPAAKPGAGKRSRMGNSQREEILAQLPKIMGAGKMKKGDIISKLGIADNQWNTVRKAAGKKLKMHGDKRSAEYSWEG